MLIMRKENRLIDDFRKQTILDTTFDEPETEEFTEDDDDDFSELFNKYLREDLEVFPDGEIDQNQNISVKVEILRPIPNPREELDKLVGCADIKRRCYDTRGHYPRDMWWFVTAAPLSAPCGATRNGR